MKLIYRPKFLDTKLIFSFNVKTIGCRCAFDEHRSIIDKVKLILTFLIVNLVFVLLLILIIVLSSLVSIQNAYYLGMAFAGVFAVLNVTVYAYIERFFTIQRAWQFHVGNSPVFLSD